MAGACRRAALDRRPRTTSRVMWCHGLRLKIPRKRARNVDDPCDVRCPDLPARGTTSFGSLARAAAEPSRDRRPQGLLKSALKPKPAITHGMQQFRECQTRKSPGHSIASSSQRVEQGFGLLEVERVETFGEPAVHRSEEIAGFIPPALIAIKPRQAHRRAQLP